MKSEELPESVKTAIVEGRITYEDVEPYIEELKQHPEAVEMFIEEFVIRRNEEKIYREAEIKRDKAIIKGEIKPIVTKYSPSPDEKRFKKFDEVYTKVHYWQWFDITSIRDSELRSKAISRLRQTRDHIDALLKKVE